MKTVFFVAIALTFAGCSEIKMGDGVVLSEHGYIYNQNHDGGGDPTFDKMPYVIRIDTKEGDCYYYFEGETKNEEMAALEKKIEVGTKVQIPIRRFAAPAGMDTFECGVQKELFSNPQDPSRYYNTGPLMNIREIEIKSD